MAESSTYTRSVQVGSDEDYSRSVLGGSVEDYSRSVLGGSDEDYSRSVLGGSDEDYSRSVLGGSDEDYSRSVLGGSDEDYSRSVLGGSDEDYSRSVRSGSDKDYSRSVLGGSDQGYRGSVLGRSDKDYSRSVLSGSDVDYSRSMRGGLDKDYCRSVLGGSDEDYCRSLLGGSDVDFSRTIVSGSDEVKETLCEPCQNEGNVSTAFKYCTDCSEYLCRPCSKHHIHFKAFRHHVVKDLESVKTVINKDSTTVIANSSDKIFQLDVNSDQMQKRPGQVTSSSGAIRNVSANLVSTIDVRTSNDTESPFIYDLTVLHKHYCVVTDMHNKSVKVVDTRTRCVTSQIQLSDAEGGWSIISVNDDRVALAVNIKVRKTDRKLLFFTTNTTSDFWKILLFSVSASGIISDTHKSIEKENSYNGITHSNDRFYAATFSRIDVISMQGQIITTFTNKSFCGLRGIALSNDHNTLYVCSIFNNTVFSVDLNGNVTASYKDLKSPYGITVDSDGYVYACSPGSVCVHQLTADLNKGQVIIKDVDVWSVAFNKNDKSLKNLVRGEKIKAYKMTYG